ncbi:MAG: efflux RND transporter periplasmic adaptor subunit [Opitutales bacterium]
MKALQITDLIAAGEAMQPPPIAVTVAEVEPDVWPQSIRVVGTLEAVNGVFVEAERAGKIKQIRFKPGQDVTQDAVLVIQDASAEEARLRSLEATAELARLEFERSTQLMREDTIAQSEFDQSKAEYDIAVADVENQREEVAKRVIKAPFAGRLGVRLVNLGQILESGTQIVSLQSLDPIYVNFSLPQQELSRVAPGMTVAVRNPTLGADGKATGTITTINPEVDTRTRNVLVQATLANSDGTLRPGMFVNVEVKLPNDLNVLRIPQTAVLSAPYGDSVFILEEGEAQKTVRQEFVRLGQRRGDFVEVLKGLDAGETVVSTAVFRLRNNVGVRVVDDKEPTQELSPIVADN